ncbi:MAG: steroid 5-alpha reductase family enzyme [Thermoproteota archaeon]
MIPFISVAIIFHLFFIYCTIKKNLGFIDTAWGLSFIVFHLSAYLMYNPTGLKPLIIVISISIWGIRLAGYLHKRNQGKPEDFRYALMRKGWGPNQALNSYIKVFWLQAILMMIIAIPSYLAVQINGELSTLNLVGLGIWIFGISWEVWADSTLAHFKKNSKGICKVGPWKYSRHPNYFGEIILWWGIFIMTLPGPLWTVIGPILISLLVSKVSGVPMLEEKYKNNPEYLEYIRTTNALIPKLF